MRNELSKLALILLSVSPLSCEKDSRTEIMQKAQPTTKLEYSIERENINKRLRLLNDQNQIRWIYCLSDTGNIILSSPVLVKVTSSTKRLEPSTGRVYGGHDYHIINGNEYVSDELMSADGTFGQSDQYIFWFTPEGQYFQWSGKYILSDVPLKLEKSVLSTDDVDYAELERGEKKEEALREVERIYNNLKAEAEK